MLWCATCTKHPGGLIATALRRRISSFSRLSCDHYKRHIRIGQAPGDYCKVVLDPADALVGVMTLGLLLIEADEFPLVYVCEGRAKLYDLVQPIEGRRSSGCPHSVGSVRTRTRNPISDRNGRLWRTLTNRMMMREHPPLSEDYQLDCRRRPGWPLLEARQ